MWIPHEECSFLADYGKGGAASNYKQRVVVAILHMQGASTVVTSSSLQ